MLATGGRVSHASVTRLRGELQEAEAMVKNLRDLFTQEFKGDAVEQMLLAAAQMDYWLWNPCRAEAMHQVEDLKDNWQERQKGEAEALAQLQKGERAQKRANVDQDHKAEITMAQRNRIEANRAQALAKKVAMEERGATGALVRLRFSGGAQEVVGAGEDHQGGGQHHQGGGEDHRGGGQDHQVPGDDLGGVFCNPRGGGSKLQLRVYGLEHRPRA